MLGFRCAVLPGCTKPTTLPNIIAEQTWHSLIFQLMGRQSRGNFPHSLNVRDECGRKQLVRGDKEDEGGQSWPQLGVHQLFFTMPIRLGFSDYKNWKLQCLLQALLFCSALVDKWSSKRLLLINNTPFFPTWTLKNSQNLTWISAVGSVLRVVWLEEGKIA